MVALRRSGVARSSFGSFTGSEGTTEQREGRTLSVKVRQALLDLGNREMTECGERIEFSEPGFGFHARIIARKTRRRYGSRTDLLRLRWETEAAPLSAVGGDQGPDDGRKKLLR